MYVRMPPRRIWTIPVDGFDWDEGNRGKCLKHGVSLAEIEAVFRHGPLIAADAGHSRNEFRSIAIGRNTDGRHLFVAFTLRRAGEVRLIRPISARCMHAMEVSRFEAQGS